MEPLTRAVALYRDDFLAGFTLRDSVNFDDWQFFQTEDLCLEYTRVLERLIRCYSDAGQHESAIRHARRWPELDRLHEPAHRMLMQLYEWTGRRSAALRQYQECVRLLDDELGQWRERPLGVIPYLVLDARYEKIRQAGAVVSCAVLIAVGVGQDGRRSVVGVSISLSEAETHWREFLESLLTRGMKGVRHVTSDHHAGLRAALNARLPGVPWQRCQCHLQRNAQAHAPKASMRKEIATDLRDVFAAPDRPEADRRLRQYVDKYRNRDCTSLADWMEENVPQSLTVFVLPPQHRVRLRTTNMLEGLNKQIKRRTSVAGLFPNEASALRLVSAVVMEISQDWETGKVYLSMDSKDQEDD